ncbi:MAG TPA: SHOCT domain-containing protein [Candidatus Polarisedimenticolia bacterium]|nr:SHOCT domain-containing protein [Candidatus Polarisedimenticolia bacterium]
MHIAQAIPLADTWMHGGWGWGWMSLMMVVMVLFWGAIIFGVVWLIRGASRGGSAPAEKVASRESPVEILERRFAEGEITEDDYRARREVLATEGTTGANGARKDKLLTAP